MKICGDDCIPCCDYCMHVIHSVWVRDGKEVPGAPIGCKFRDEEHQKVARVDSYCADFYCFMIEGAPSFELRYAWFELVYQLKRSPLVIGVIRFAKRILRYLDKVFGSL